MFLDVIKLSPRSEHEEKSKKDLLLRMASFDVPNLKKRSLLKLGEDKHGNPYIRGLTEVNVTSAEEALKLLTIGQKNLRKAATKLNHNSSRRDIPPRMIPYRDSKLTRLFQGFFSGRGKAVMIVNVNKCSTLFDETLQVFKFSAIAKQGLLDIIDNCKKAIANLKESLAKEKKERMLDEIKFRDEITKELMEQFVAIEKNYTEKIQDSQLKAEDATDNKITKMLETLNPAKKRSHDEMEPEEEMVPLHVLQESQKKIAKPAECEVCQARSENTWQLKPELKNQAGTANGVRSLRSHRDSLHRGQAANTAVTRKEKDGGTKQRSPWFSCMGIGAGKKRKSNVPDLLRGTKNAVSQYRLRDMVVEKADESRVLRVMLNNTRGLVPTPTKTSLLRSKKFPSSKDLNSENASSSPVMSLQADVSRLGKGGKKKDASPGVKRRMLAPICTNLIGDKKLKGRRRSSLVCSKRNSVSFSKRYNLRSKN
ncbi:KIF20 [Acanthosepion pharaonis]|uniref:KIF20 n=1 Tax=Acanthosepion pharaonis TaxID=158019 RepID=A0A812CNY5_ACAPH|nr:KIF20 [Sepia pharaonis]